MPAVRQIAYARTTSQPYDLHAWAGRRARPVSAETEISYDDYSRMGVHQHKASGERRKPTPTWAVNFPALLDLLVRFMERRAQLRPGEGALQERLDRACRARKRRLPEMKRTLKKLCDPYVASRRRKRRAKLAAHIRNLDAEICSIQRGEPGVVLRAVYLYHRARLDSVGVSAEVKISPPNVRQILYKLDKIWVQEFAPHRPSRPKRRGSGA